MYFGPIFDPFLTHFWSQNAPFSRLFGTFGGPKRVSSHPRAYVVPLSNSRFEPKTQRWRPWAVAPSCGVPFQMWVFWGPKTAFFLPNPKACSKSPNQGKTVAHFTSGLASSCQSAFQFPLTPQCVRETPPRGPQKPQNLHNI